MGLYLYCIGDADHPDPAAVAGVGDADVRAVEVEGFRLWVSDLEEPPTASLDPIKRHNEVVEAAAVDRTPLPVRFGQWFESVDDVGRRIRDRHDRLRQALEAVRDAEEYGVRVVDPRQSRSAPPDRTTGTAYLESLARRERDTAEDARRGEELAQELRVVLGDAIRDQRVRAGSGALARIAHLVPRHDTGTYRARVGTFPERHPELEFTMSGPWPPYGFADDGL